MYKPYKNIADLPHHIPVFPLGAALLLPRANLPLNIFEPRYLAMVEDALGTGRMIGIIQPRLNLDEPADDDSDAPLYEVGCLGRITSFDETSDGRLLISLTGIARFIKLEEIATTTPYRQLHVDYKNYAQDLVADIGALDVKREKLLDVLRLYLDRQGLTADWEAIGTTANEILVNSLSIISPYGTREKQALLEAATLAERNDILIALTEIALAQSHDINAGGEENNDNDNLLQ